MKFSFFCSFIRYFDFIFKIMVTVKNFALFCFIILLYIFYTFLFINYIFFLVFVLIYALIARKSLQNLLLSSASRYKSRILSERKRQKLQTLFMEHLMNIIVMDSELSGKKLEFSKVYLLFVYCFLIYP